MFAAAGSPGERWRQGGERLLFASELWPRIDFSPFRLQVGYEEAAIRQTASSRNYFAEVRLPSGRKIAVERWPVAPSVELSGEEISRFEGLLLRGEENGTEGALGEKGEAVGRFEFIPEGLQEYF